MANKLRGEVTLKLDGKNYTLRPTFGTLCELEDAYEAPILRIMEDMRGGKIRLSGLAKVIFSGVHGFDHETEITVEQIGELIVKDGLLKVMEQKGENGINPITQYILNGVLGGEEDGGKGSQKKPIAATTKKTKEQS